MSFLKSVVVPGVVAFVVAYFVGGAAVPQFAGLNHNALEDFSEGISVDGTVVIDGSGNYDGAVTAGANGVTTDDLTVGDDGIVTDDLIVGAAAASASSLELSVLDATATASFGLDSGGAVGSCIEMRNTVGATVYARVVGTTWTVNTTSCK